jgi:hypothetical protein
MTDEHRTFSIYSTAMPITDQLMGHISRWYPAGSIDYRRRDHSVLELTRFQIKSLDFDDKPIAELFSLELGRLLVDTHYRELVIERYESEKKRIQKGADKRQRLVE